MRTRTSPAAAVEQRRTPSSAGRPRGPTRGRAPRGWQKNEARELPPGPHQALPCLAAPGRAAPSRAPPGRAEPRPALPRWASRTTVKPVGGPNVGAPDDFSGGTAMPDDLPDTSDFPDLPPLPPLDFDAPEPAG